MASNSTEKPERSVESVLLNSAENEKLFSLLEYRSQSLASTVVQVFTFDTDEKWTKLCCGVACFIKDYKQASYFIRVYDIMVGERIYEHELYNNFEYNRRTSFFHDFAGEDSWIGLNFANDDEADKFNEAIQSYLLKKKEKRLQRRHTKGTIQQTQVPPPPVPSISAQSTEKDKSSKKVKDKKDKAKKRFSKSDITGPSNFIHIGYGDSRQSDLNDKELTEWLEQIGMSDKVQSSSQLDFIRQWVQDHAGRDAVEKDKERVRRASTKRGPPPTVLSSQPRDNRESSPVLLTPPTSRLQPSVPPLTESTELTELEVPPPSPPPPPPVNETVTEEHRLTPNIFLGATNHYQEKEKSSKKGKDEKDKAKERILISDITSETNFIHSDHDDNGQLTKKADCTNGRSTGVMSESPLNDEELREWLEQIDILDKVRTSAQLDFIRQWVQDRGGRVAVEKDEEKVRRDSTERGPPPPVLSSQPRDNRGSSPFLLTPPTARLQPSAPPLTEWETPPPSPPPPPTATGVPAPPQ